MSARPKARFCQYCGSTGERLYSVNTVAVMLDCSPETIWCWVKERKIGSVKFGRLRRIPAKELKKLGIRCPSLGEVVENAVK